MTQRTGFRATHTKATHTKATQTKATHTKAAPTNGALGIVARSSMICALMTAAMLSGAGPASASTASGCSAKITSATSTGAVLRRIEVPGPGATKADPLVLDYGGTVTWSGSTDQAIRNGRWEVRAWPFTLSGRMTNASGTTSKSGVDKVSDRLPVKVPGLIQVKVRLAGGSAVCTASGWAKLRGSPTFTPVWFGGGLLVLVGAGGFVLMLRPRSVRLAKVVGQS